MVEFSSVYAGYAIPHVMPLLLTRGSPGGFDPPPVRESSRPLNPRPAPGVAESPRQSPRQPQGYRVGLKTSSGRPDRDATADVSCRLSFCVNYGVRTALNSRRDCGCHGVKRNRDHGAARQARRGEHRIAQFSQQQVDRHCPVRAGDDCDLAVAADGRDLAHDDDQVVGRVARRCERRDPVE